MVVTPPLRRPERARRLTPAIVLLSWAALAAGMASATGRVSAAPPGVRCSLELERVDGAGPAGALAVGDRFRVRLVLEARESFPAKGETVQLLLPHYHGFRMSSIPQAADPARPGYTRIVRGPPGARLRTIAPRLAALADDTPIACEVLFGEPIAAGTRLEVVYGDGARGAAEAPELAVDPSRPGYRPIRCLLLAEDGTPAAELARLSPAVSAGPAARLGIVCRASARPGEEVPTRIVALDRAGNRAMHFAGRVRLTAPGADPPSVSVTLRAADAGATTVRGLRFRREGVHRLRGETDSPRRILGRGNPVRVESEGFRIVFGDLHVHCGEASSDAYGGADEVFRLGREEASLDFVARTDHDGDMTPGFWARSRRIAAARTSPGAFVALLGFEWTPARSWGHRSVLFPASEGEVVACGLPSGDTPEKLWNSISRHGAIAIPHMPSAEPVEHHRIDWSRHHPELEPLVEIDSQWNPLQVRLLGQDAETNPEGVQRALSLGYRMGFVAGSDNHTGMPGRTGGIAGMLVTTLDANGLWEAMRGRRTFATSGSRTIVELRCGAVLAGGVRKLEDGAAVLSVRVAGTGPLERIEIVKGWTGAPVPFEVAHVHRCEGAEDVAFDWPDRAPRSGSLYYARAFQQDGERAWSSPLWIELASGTRSTPGTDAAARSPRVPAESSLPRKRESSRRRPGRESWAPAFAGATTRAFKPHDVDFFRRPARSPARGWIDVPLPRFGGVETLHDPSPHAWSASTFPDGFSLSVDRVRWMPPSETARTLSFRARAGPVVLEAGRRYRVACSVGSDRPGQAMLALMDDRFENSGCFLSWVLPGGPAPFPREREFTPRPHRGPVSFWMFLSAAMTRYTVSGLSLQVERR